MGGVRLAGEVGVELSARRPGTALWIGEGLGAAGDGGGAGAIRAEVNPATEGRARIDSDRKAGAFAGLLEADGAGAGAALSGRPGGAGEDAVGGEELLAAFGGGGAAAGRAAAPLGATDAGCIAARGAAGVSTGLGGGGGAELSAMRPGDELWTGAGPAGLGGGGAGAIRAAAPPGRIPMPPIPPIMPPIIPPIPGGPAVVPPVPLPSELSPVGSVPPGVPEGTLPAGVPELAVLEAEPSELGGEPSAGGAPGLVTLGFSVLATWPGTP